MDESQKDAGKVNENYIDALKEYSNYLIARGAYQDAYKTCLEAIELSKSLFGTDRNLFSSVLYSNMAQAKFELGQVEDSINIIVKAKKIEEELNSRTSPKYKEICSIEEVFNARLRERKRKYKGKSSILKKLAPNTPLKLGIYIGVIALVAVGATIKIKA